MSTLIKYLVFSLSNKLKKLKPGSEESLTPRKCSELRVKVQSFELLVCVRDHIQSLNLLIKQKLKKNKKTKLLCLCISLNKSLHI